MQQQQGMVHRVDFFAIKKNIFGDFSLNILITFAITKMNIIYFIVIFVIGQGSPSLCNEVSIEYIQPLVTHSILRLHRSFSSEVKDDNAKKKEKKEDNCTIHSYIQLRKDIQEKSSFSSIFSNLFIFWTFPYSNISTGVHIHGVGQPGAGTNTRSTQLMQQDKCYLLVLHQSRKSKV